MEIERAASTVVEGSAENQSQAPQPAHLKAPLESFGEKKSAGGKALSFRDVEGAQQHDLDSMLGDQVHAKAGKTADPDEDEDDVEIDDEDLPEDEEEAEEAEEEDDSDEEDDEEEPSDEELEGFDKIKKEFDKEGKVTVKVNGKDKKLTFQELKNFASSGINNHEIYQSFQTEKKAFEEEINTSRAQIAFANAKLTPAWNAIKEKNVEGAVVALAEQAGLDILQVRRSLRDQMLPQILRRLNMGSDEFRQRVEQNRALNAFLDTQEENEYFKQERARLLQAQQAAQSPDPNREAEESFRQMQIEHGISNKDLQWAHEYQNRRAQEAGQQPDLRADTLVGLILNRRICDKAVEAIDSVRPRLVNDQAFVDRVVQKVVKNPDWTTSRIARWVYKQAREMNNPSTKQQELAKEVSRKVLKSKPKSSFESPGAGRNKPMKFSDFGDGGDSLL